MSNHPSRSSLANSLPSHTKSSNHSIFSKRKIQNTKGSCLNLIKRHMSYGLVHKYVISFKRWFIWNGKRDLVWERIFDSLIHYPNVHISRGWATLSQEAGAPCGSPIWLGGSRAHKTLSILLGFLLVESSLLKWGVSGTPHQVLSCGMYASQGTGQPNVPQHLALIYTFIIADVLAKFCKFST